MFILFIVKKEALHSYQKKKEEALQFTGCNMKVVIILFERKKGNERRRKNKDLYAFIPKK